MLSGDPFTGGLLDFDTHTPDPYALQDGTGGHAAIVVTADDGLLAQISGNAWKDIDADYDVTPRTRLRFDFRADSPAEIYAIALDDDDDFANASNNFVLAHTQTLANTPVESAFVTDDADNSLIGTGWRSYDIAVGEHWTGAAEVLRLIADDDAAGDADASFRNLRLIEAGQVLFDPAHIQSDGTQDGPYGQATAATPTADRQGVRLTGNAWKRLDVDYHVTPDTLLTLEARFDRPGELYGVALDDNADYADDPRNFVLAGTQDLTGTPVEHAFLNDHRDDAALAAPGWRSYTLRVGEHWTGDASTLRLFADQDAAGSADVTFRNLRLHEAGDVDGDGTVDVQLTHDPDAAARKQVAFHAQARFGNASATGGDWELGLKIDTNQSAQDEAQHAWTSGVAQAFTFAFDPADNAATLSVGGSTADYTYSSLIDTPITDLFIGAASYKPDASIQVANLALDGAAVTGGVGADYNDAGQSVFNEVRLGGIDWSQPVTLTGDMTMAWGATPPSHSQLFAMIMPAAVQEATIENTSRGGDRVVSADLGEGAQGEKELTIKFGSAPTENLPYTIRVLKVNGNKGSATIEDHDEGQSDQRTVTGGGKSQLVTILGGESSDVPRNVAVEVLNANGDVVSDRLLLTVFEATLDAAHDNTATIDPNMNSVSTDGQPFNHKTIAQQKYGDAKLGHRSPTGPEGPRVAGSMSWIQITAKLTTDDLDPQDFVRESDGSGFDFKRRVTKRTYFNEVLLQVQGSIKNDADDDPDNEDEDLLADRKAGDGDTHLYLYSLDHPLIGFTPNSRLGDVQCRRSNFKEWLEYDGVRISPKYDWWEAQSIELGDGVVLRNDDYNADATSDDDDDDNNVGWDGTIQLSKDLR